MSRSWLQSCLAEVPFLSERDRRKSNFTQIEESPEVSLPLVIPLCPSRLIGGMKKNRSPKAEPTSASGVIENCSNSEGCVALLLVVLLFLVAGETCCRHGLRALGGFGGYVEAGFDCCEDRSSQEQSHHSSNVGEECEEVVGLLLAPSLGVLRQEVEEDVEVPRLVLGGVKGQRVLKDSAPLQALFP